MSYKENFTLTGFADEIDKSLDKQIEVIKKLGISFIEMRGVDGKNLVEYSLDEVKGIKKRLDENGIRLSAVGSPLGKIKITEDFEQHMELFKHTVEIAKIMETSYIRLFSFFTSDEERSEYRDEVLKRLGSFLEHAKENDIIILHENEKDIYGEKADCCLDIMKNYYCDNFKAIFDFANFVQAGQDTLEAFNMLKPYIVYVHIKDAKFEDGDVVPPGYGDGNLKDILQMLKNEGYKGFLSLEPHLGNFDGFEVLEKEGKIGGKLSGEEAYTLAHDSLIKILEELE